MGPGLDVFHQTRTVDLTAAERHPPIVETASLHWHSEDDTQRFAARLAATPVLRNAFIELHGDLGAGKTTLVRHLLRALGVQGRIKSPTYAVVEPHEAPGLPGAAPLAVWHFDFYRFNDPREWEDAGFRDLFACPGLKLAEWPEKAAAVLPPPDLVLHIEAAGDETRTVSLSAHSPTGQALLEACA
ncbi:MAG: tRNA (adenosine(37)-N6)-threonylcarbamoyltransferase complex ATPase subunit type 1 TsaE [Ramlibacter sp.]|nr:tRNA (adenosine(37)-N6)-threonylcarbamoyltransferase complex ATPase subunit type 1 TsaE [Ramlibacter sp.]MBX3658975.1 tRNA (adenosine(37)-N6)-threonylcarbamoyltransferase complex ATPase subunit type 1 TsaE [Ramlibacter sp.]